MIFGGHSRVHLHGLLRSKTIVLAAGETGSPFVFPRRFLGLPADLSLLAA